MWPMALYLRTIFIVVDLAQPSFRVHRHRLLQGLSTRAL